MIGPLSDNTYKLVSSIIKAILNDPDFAKQILQLKQKWHQEEEIGKDSTYCAMQFGLEAEELFRETAGKQYWFESLKEILKDENHSKDLSLGDFVLRLYNGRGSIQVDTKFCYTEIPGCYGGFSLNNERAFGGWDLCFSTNCDSALLIYAEYIRELIDTGELDVKHRSNYLYKDYKGIVEKGIEAGFIIRIDK